jgi:hypothetical protein
LKLDTTKEKLANHAQRSLQDGMRSPLDTTEPSPKPRPKINAISIVVVVGFVIIVWVIIGQNILPSGSPGTGTGGTGGTPGTGGGKCDACEADQKAYRALSQVKQGLAAADWGIKYTLCRAKGCL